MTLLLSERTASLQESMNSYMECSRAFVRSVGAQMGLPSDWLSTITISQERYGVSCVGLVISSLATYATLQRLFSAPPFTSARET